MWWAIGYLIIGLVGGKIVFHYTEEDSNCPEFEGMLVTVFWPLVLIGFLLTLWFRLRARR